jgi:hypothetical protein
MTGYGASRQRALTTDGFNRRKLHTVGTGSLESNQINRIQRTFRITKRAQGCHSAGAGRRRAARAGAAPGGARGRRHRRGPRPRTAPPAGGRRQPGAAPAGGGARGPRGSGGTAPSRRRGAAASGAGRGGARRSPRRPAAICGGRPMTGHGASRQRALTTDGFNRGSCRLLAQGHWRQTRLIEFLRHSG